MLLRILFILSIFFSSNSLFSQNISVNFTFHNYNNDTLIIGTLFGAKQMAIDTLLNYSQNAFNWQPPKDTPPGIYFAWLRSENLFIQFLINGKEKDLSLEVDIANPKSVKVLGSAENELFHNYLNFLGQQQELKDSTRSQLNKAKETGAPHELLEDRLEEIQKSVTQYQKDKANTHPGTLTAFLLKGILEPDVPEFDIEDEKELQAMSYYYYRDHYFDNIDMSHPALMRSSFIHTKVNDYIHKVSYLHPDSMKVSIDVVMKKLEVNPEAYRYFLADLLNAYSALSIAGQDALYVHLVDNYYNKGKAPWVGPSNLEKINSFANNLRPSLLGNIMSDFVTYKEDGTAVSLHAIDADYTVLFFWDPTCSHCKKVFPIVREFHNKYGEKGKVEVVTICSKGGERYPKCWEYLKDNDYGHLLNTGDEFQRYNEIHRFNKFPKAIILDRSKKVLMKDFNPEKLESVFNNVIKQKNQ